MKCGAMARPEPNVSETRALAAFIADMFTVAASARSSYVARVMRL